ncbi:uroporphyrinogen-III synthase [Rhodovibrionaceae bacterium A322]
MKLWVTRPIADAQDTAEQLRARGHDVLLAPLLQISALPLPPLRTEGLAGLIITSRNAARRLQELTERRDLPVFAVGQATANLLTDAGFQKVHSAGGDLSSLGSLLRQQLPTFSPAAEERLLHLSGRHLAGDLTPVLSDLGYELDRLEAYHSLPVKDFPGSVRTSIVTNQLDGVLLYSPRTAKVLLSLLGDQEMGENCRNMVAFCLSDKIAEAVRSLPWKEVVVAEAPSQDQMLEAIDQHSDPQV